MSSVCLAHCTYCLATRGNSTHGPTVTFTRGCFTIRAEHTRLIRRHLLSCRQIRTQARLTRARGLLSNILCRHKMSDGNFTVVHSGKSGTLFYLSATLLGHGLNTPSDHLLTSFLPAVDVGTGSFTTRVTSVGMRRGSLCKRSSVRGRRVRGGATIQGVVMDQKVCPRRLSTNRSLGGIRHHLGSRRGGVAGGW